MIVYILLSRKVSGILINLQCLINHYFIDVFNFTKTSSDFSTDILQDDNNAAKRKLRKINKYLKHKIEIRKFHVETTIVYNERA